MGTDRRVVLEAGIVRVAKDARYGEVGEVKYLRSTRGIKGGSLDVFVHSGDETLRGREVVGKAIVMERKLSDGRRYLYVDVTPEEGVEETHRILVCSLHDAKKVPVVEGAHRFPMPQPLAGALFLLPADLKVNLEEDASAPSDPQLDKKLGEGWEIGEDRGSTVVLFKMKGGVRKEIVHHRPKR